MREPDQQLRAGVRAHLLDEVERVRGEEHVQRVDRSPRWASVVAFALVLAVLLGVGITTALVVAERHGTSDPARTTRPTRRPVAVVDPLVVAENEVVGTGVFRGHVRGRFTIRYFDGVSTLHLAATALGSPLARDVQVAVSADAAGCGIEDSTTVAGLSDALTQEQPLVIPDSDPSVPFLDLSRWSTLAVVPPEGDNWCDRSLYTTASIHWHLPAAIRDLASTDRGARAAARGPVELRAGRPIAYTVVADDQMASVAARFGMTPNDLLYLNPVRRSGNDPELYIGEHLNLDPLNRSRTWR